MRWKMKILDVNEVNTKFNHYHKFINWFFMTWYIRSFNKVLKKAYIRGSRYIECDQVSNLKKVSFHSGRSEKSAQLGERRAITLISNRYEFESQVMNFGIKNRFVIRPISREDGHGC